ncbi:response regulator transcription factor [Chloroflexota bacterium]
MQTGLTTRERDILILSAKNIDGKCPSNAEIAQLLGLSVSVVKAAIHRACSKLEARNRYEAIVKAVLKGEIKINEIHSIDEIAEIHIGLYDFNMQRRILHLLHQWLEHGYLMPEDIQIVQMNRRRGNLLTETERDVVTLLAYGYTNNEIAGRLYISSATVRAYLYRACNKLGVNSRADLFVVASKKGEINACDFIPPGKFISAITAMGARNVEELAKLLDRKLEREAIATSN